MRGLEPGGWNIFAPTPRKTDCLRQQGSVIGTLAILFAGLQLLERRRQDIRSAVLVASQLMTGGTQPRSAGIAIIEGVWEDGKHTRGILIPLLANQAVYLLTESESETEHERDNLARMFKLLERAATESLAVGNVCGALKKRINGHSGGIPVEQIQLEAWQRILRC